MIVIKNNLNWGINIEIQLRKCNYVNGHAMYRLFLSKLEFYYTIIDLLRFNEALTTRVMNKI